MSRRLEGQTAWISGAASGIGEAVARLFAAEGARVAIVDLQVGRARQLQQELLSAGGQALAVPGDVSSEADIQQSIADTVSHFGGLQIIVNCAGIVHVQTLDEYSTADWEQLMAVNLRSVFLSVRHGIAHLRQNVRSYVVNLGSISSFVGQSSTPAYTAAKYAVLGLSRSIALDYAADGVRCNCVCPGITDTPMLRQHMSPNFGERLAERLHRVPLGRALKAEEVARAALYFSCEDSAGVTGTSLVIDGGYLAAAEWNRRDVALPGDLP
jgi:NAD(P)-dependent dehydrogenase (short-subunit alcohol dehydrogenase family)